MARSSRKFVIAAALLLAIPPIAYWLVRAWSVYAAETAEFADRRARIPALGGELPERRTWNLAGVGPQRGWLLPSSDATYAVVVHGSPGTGLGMLPFGRALARSGVGVLLLDLPGYGESVGDRCWDGKFDAAVGAAIDHLVAFERPQRIVGLGYSLGTCVLGRAAAADPRLERLVLLAPLTRLSSQLRHQFRSRLPWLPDVAILAARHQGVAVDELDLLKAAPRLGDRAVLLVVGSRDAATPPEMAAELHGAMSASELLVIAGRGHTDLLDAGGEPLVQRIVGFLRE